MTPTNTEALAALLQSAVKTYPQMSEDEPGGYCTAEDQLMDEAAAELRRLLAERDALAADAERYRWLVSRPCDGDDDFYISAEGSKQANSDGWWALGGDMSKNDADAYIDAAMKDHP